jgi:hypothetical protein
VNFVLLLKRRSSSGDTAVKSRQAALRADLAVDLPYPRHRDHPELLRLRREALGLLGLAGDW